jgi:4-hydroxy-tetrahydrodipicolinate synthase
MTMFEGIFTAVVTPMNADGSLVTDSWEEQVRRQVAAGIHGLIIGGTTGEFYALTVDERIDQFKRAGKLLGKKTPWLAGVNAITTEDAVRLARAATEAGAPGLLVGAPPYSSPTQSELAQHCIQIDDASGLPIVLYNYPARTNADMNDEFFEAIKGRKNFVGLKESTGDMKRTLAMLRDHPHIGICCGSEDLALDFFGWGARMWICATSNFNPERIVALYDACVIKGDFNEGRRIALELAPLMNALEQGGKFIAAVKHACSRVGICQPYVRSPLGLLSDQESRHLDAMLSDLGIETKELNRE